METLIVDPVPLRQTLSLSTGITIFLPATSPLCGGMALRVYPDEQPRLLVPNPFGTGVMVAGIDGRDILGFTLTAFDRVLIRHLVSFQTLTPQDVRERFLDTAAKGFAGRETQKLARIATNGRTVRRAAIHRSVSELLAGIAVHPGLSAYLENIFFHLGFSPACIRAGKGDMALNERVPPRLAIVRNALRGLAPCLNSLEGNALVTARVIMVATEALRRIEALYVAHAGLLNDPARLAHFNVSYEGAIREIATLDGWVRFALLLEEIPRAPCAVHMLADLASLAQILSHSNHASAARSPLASVGRPSFTSWPPEVDRALYIEERNERLIHMSLFYDIKEN
ncbi:hypothetical protein [Acetobacter sp.]|jgi:hypothetical protein|uniref:hypothetical protein n=1 Tax=Acetobacter sp. TaxID=440 RepID=UPI0025B8089A|nr:hypothetical protein [Acetobacter sp.]MCH4090644.1 hypothetical protein [Acetobacter sp.]MCI1300087.1 hypothetical protein [Acetobacter sp.]MCI1316505.1 hypothetical protein [Acetobacter sp.]